ncbi:MAG: hypothetical protein QOH88_2734 [Verrucomicrobiota bacterium]|jgi:hypothetical protein
MRRAFFRIALLVVGLVAISLFWILGGRQLALFVDRFGTAEIARIPVTGLNYHGAGSGGTLFIEEKILTANGVDDRPFPLRIARDNGKLVLSISGRSFALGSLSFTSKGEGETDGYGVLMDSQDSAVLSERRSYLSWPTPFNFNFMTGHASSWRRLRYYELNWKKPDGSRLRMLWRYEQYFYPSFGWTEGSITSPGTTGLLTAEINP